MAKFTLSISYGNSTPERGFSTNKVMLHAHGHNIYEEALVVLRTVKDELNRVECVTKFEIDKELIKGTRS